MGFGNPYLVSSIKDRQIQMCRVAFARRYTAYDISSIGNGISCIGSCLNTSSPISTLFCEKQGSSVIHTAFPVNPVLCE